MATYFARKAGNINATDVWSTTPTGAASDLFPTFTSSDVLMSNSFIITVNVNTTVAEVRNDTTGSATVGGRFTLNDGVTLTANVFGNAVNNQLGAVTFAGANPQSASIVGNCTAGSGSQSHGANNTSTGTLTIVGNCTGGGSGSVGAFNSSTGILVITGNVTGGSGGTNGGVTASGTRNALGGSITITGNSTGGSGSPGADNAGVGTITINGISSGGSGSTGASNASTGTVNIIRAKANAYGPGNTSGLAAAVGASNVGLGVIEIQELEFGEYGMTPTSGTGIRLKKLGSNVAIFPYVDAGAAKTLVDATQGEMPDESDVRTGVSYASGALTGTCAVPAASSVGFGVPVDATTGTAALTPASVWDHLLSAITTSSTIGTLLKTNIDATISSRSTATTAGIADAVWDEILTGATHNIASSAGRRLRALGNQIILENSAVTSTTNSITFNGLASAITGAYDPALIYIVEGTGVGQCRNILEYRGATKTAIVDRDWRVPPDDTSNYVIVANAGREHVNEGAATGGSSNTIILNASASTTDDAYNGQVVFIRSGIGADQARRVVGYVGSTRTATVDRVWATAPTTESAYVMLPTGEFSQDYVSTAIRTELTPELDEIGEIHAIHGLKSGSDLTVTPTSRTAGAISQTISGDGTTTTTVSRD